MTSINNVNRSLTTSRSIINSFLKVIALMCLFTTAGFVGDPSGLANDKKIATQVAAFSSFAVSDKEEVKPSSLLVLSLPTIVGIKNDISMSFLEKKINLRLAEENNHSGGRLPPEDEDFVYTNSSNVFIPDRHPLVHPFLPNSSNLPNESLSSEPELYIAQVASVVYLGLEKGLKWVDDSVVKVAHFMETTLWDEIVIRFGCIHQRPSWFYPLRHLRRDPHVFNHYIGLVEENHSGCLPPEDKDFVYTNSSNVFIPDRHPLVHPFLPNSNLSNGSLSSEPELYIAQVASAVYLGLEKGLKWVDDLVVKVAHFMETTLWDEIVIRFGRCIHQRPSWFYPLRHLRRDPHVFNHYIGLVEKNHPSRLPPDDQEVFVYTNSSNVFIPDRHSLVHPFLPNSSNFPNESLLLEEPELYIAQVASVVYLGLEKGLKWVDDLVVKVAHFMETTFSWDEIVIRFGRCIHQRLNWLYYPLRHLRRDPHVFNHYMVNRFAGFVRSYKVKSEKIKTHVAAFLVAATPFAEILNDGFIFIRSMMIKKNSFIFILMIFVSCIFIFHSVMAIVYWKRINSVLSRLREGSEAPLPKRTSPLLPQDLFDDDEDSEMMQKESIPDDEENTATAENWQIVGFPLTRSRKKILPFEVREYCIRYTKYHAKWTNLLNRRYPGGDPAFLVSRMVTRRMNLFYNSTMTTIMEEEEEEEEREVAMGEDVHSVVVGGEEEEEEDDDASLDVVFFDANVEEYEEDVEMVHPDNDDEEEEEEESLCLLETTATPGTVASTTGTAIIITTTTGATSTKDISMSTYPGRGKENKTHDEAVGTFSPSVQLQEGQGVTVTVEEEITNNNNLLGSGFYIDDKGRKRRFSYRLSVEKKSGKCAMKGSRGGKQE